MHPEIIIPILIMTLFSCGAVGLLIFVLLRSTIALCPYKAKNPDKDAKIKRTRKTAIWAEGSGYEFLGFYTIKYNGRDFLGVWKLKEKPRYLCQYILGSGRAMVVAWDFETIFENDIELTTSNTKDSNLFPKLPGSYNQSFSVYGFGEFQRLHIDAEQYLTEKGGAQILKSQIGFEEYFVNYLKRTNKHQWKHWYGIFLVLYFYFIRRSKWHNKTIKQQHELGMIKLPNETLLHSNRLS